MSRKHHQNAPTPRPAGSVTLAGVLAALENPGELSATRVRDARCAVRRIASLLENEPAAIALDIGMISARLAAVNPVAVGMTAKRFANVRSDFLAALKASGMMPAKAIGKGYPVVKSKTEAKGNTGPNRKVDPSQDDKKMPGGLE